MMTETDVKSAVFAAAGECSLMVHGGAWAIPDAETDAYREGIRDAVLLGREALLGGAPAISVVARVVAAMEDNGSFDAGSGAVLTADGTVELDAGIMDGATLAWGAVGAVRRIARPIEVARSLIIEGEGQVRLMVGDGAEAFAVKHGHTLVDNNTLICDRERQRLAALRAIRKYHTSHTFLEEHPRGTVGCVARDRYGHVAAATSTGGTPNRPVGRVGDTPLPGCGFYATPYAAASATGWGEGIATVLLCGSVVGDISRLAEEAPAGSSDRLQVLESVVQERLTYLGSKVHNIQGSGATAGVIVVDALGNGAFGYTTPRMARAGWQGRDDPWWIVD